MSDDKKKDRKETRYQEKFKLKMLDMKEKNKKTLCMVNLISTVITVGLVIGTLAILNKEPEACKGHQLKITLWLMLGMHATNIVEQVCSMTGLDRWCCGCICILCFFFYEVAVLVYMNSVFYSSGECEDDHPLKYWWLFFNIIVYFFFLFITIYFHCKSFFAAVSRDEVIKEMNEEEEEDKKAHSNTMH